MDLVAIEWRRGDRVRAVRESWGDDIVPVGSVGTVTQGPSLLAVAFDHDPVGDGDGHWAMLRGQLEPVGIRTRARVLARGLRQKVSQTLS